MVVKALDVNIENAMRYVSKKQHGYISELKPFGDDVISSMKSAGFLKTGWTKEEETFGATDMLRSYVEVVWGKTGLIDKFKYFINRLFIN